LAGVLTPQGNTTAEPEFAVLCPPGYGMITARLTCPAPDMVDRLAAYFVDAERHLGQFAAAPVDAYAFACTGSSYLAGLEAEAALCKKVEAETGRPFIAAAGAVRDALEILGAQRIAIVSPYPPELDEASTAYWTACGFEVTEVTKLSAKPSAAAPDAHPIYGISAEVAEAAVRALKGRVRDAGVDAIVLLGTGVPTLGAIKAVAALDGPPVLSSMLALAWRTMAAIDGRDSARDDLLDWISGRSWGARLAACLEA
jgi:maleate cis-trans isomerase